MKVIRKWALRIVSLIIVSIATIVLTLLNPGFLYANSTEVGNYVVYYDGELNPAIMERLENVESLVKASELYDPAFKVNLCLDDGALYPEIMRRARGNAFGWGFLNIAAFSGASDLAANKISLNGYDWNLEQLFAHEIAHCMQNNALGMWNSNPVASHATWKWEGYAEYVARKNEDQVSLIANMERLEKARREDPDAWGIFFADGTVAPRSYYEYWLLVQYSLDIKQMTYRELLQSDTSREEVEEEMKRYYELSVHQLNHTFD